MMRMSLGRVGAAALVIVALFVVGGAAAHITPTISTYTVAFTEKGLPTGSSWSVYFNGVTYPGTGATISISGISAANYYYSASSTVAGVAGVQYAAPAYYGYMNVPYSMSQFIIYDKQYQVTFAISPVNSGSTNPSGSTYYYAGEEFPIAAASDQGWGFASWVTSSHSLLLSNKTVESTNLVVDGTGTVTAKFTAHKSAITYTEVGLPASTTWSVISGGTTYFSSTSTITAGKVVPGTLAWSVAPVATGTGTQYAPSATSGSLNVPDDTSWSFVFTKQYQVTFAITPSGTGSTTPSGAAYYNAGSNVSVFAQSTTTTVFSSWSVSNAANLGFGSKTNSATNLTVRGPGTLTAHFVTASPCATCTATFYETGLPTGAGWGIAVNGQAYLSVVSPTTTSLSIGGWTGGFSWSTNSLVSSPGASSSNTVYVASSTAGYLYIPYQMAYTIVFVPAYYLTVQSNPQYVGTGTSPSNGYYIAGSTIPVASAGTVNLAFSKWTANTTNAVFAKSTSAATTMVLDGPATITANFVQPTTSVNFTEAGLPTGTTWGLYFNGIAYTTSAPTLIIHAVAYNSYSWSVWQPIASGTAGEQWVALSYNYGAISGSMSVPLQTEQMLLFVPEYQVSYTTSGTSGGSTAPSSTGWYLGNTLIALTATNGTAATFSSWGVTSATNLVLGSSTLPTTFLTIKGPGTVTATFS